MPGPSAAMVVSKQQLVTFAATSRCRASFDVLHERPVISFANMPDGCQYSTRVDHEPAHQPTGVGVEGGRAPRAMPALSLTAPRGRAESEALTALPSASAIGIGTLALHSSCPWACKNSIMQPFGVVGVGCHICAHPLRGVQR